MRILSLPFHLTESSQRGASVVAFALAGLPVLMLAMGTIEIAHWFATRQMISLALMEAARAGSTQHNRPQALAHGFETGLRPRYTMGSPDRTVQRVQQALQRRHADLHGQPWKLYVLSPSHHAFTDFSDPQVRVPGSQGNQIIRNSYQAEQHWAAIQRGWPGGKGPLSGQTIFQANTLTLEAIWPHRPYLPPFRAILRWLGSSGDTYTAQVMAQGYLPLKRQITQTMQSHPVQWSVTEEPSVTLLFNQPESCRGWLCQQTDADLKPLDISPADAAISPWTQGSHAPDAEAQSGKEANNSTHQLPIVLPDDPACGVSLCCA